MKILVDMNLSPRWATELRSAGFDAIHWSQVGKVTAPDEEVLAWCAAHGHVLFTHDLDFGAILSASESAAPSVVQLRTHDVTPEATLARVADALRRAEDDLLEGVLMTVEPARLRIRLLPLTRR